MEKKMLFNSLRTYFILSINGASTKLTSKFMRTCVENQFKLCATETFDWNAEVCLWRDARERFAQIMTLEDT